MPDYTTLTEEELHQAQADVNFEISRRYTMEVVPQQINALNVGYLEAEGTTHGDDWRQPTGAHDAYPIDWVVAHEGKTWVSLVFSNVWEPGVANWREDAVEGNEYPDWVQPTGAHDAYPLGAKVSHDGKHWLNTVDSNVWVPGEYGWTEQP